MVLPSIETTPVLMMRFTKKADEELIYLVKESLASGGLILVVEEKTRSGNIILGLTTTQEELEQEAEHVQLLKKTNDKPTPIMEYFTVIERERFMLSDDDDDSNERDKYGIFSYNDWAFLVWSILDKIDALPNDMHVTNLTRKLDGLKVPYLHRADSQLFKKTKLTRDVVLNHTESEKLRHVLEHSEFIDVITPVHVRRVKKDIMMNMWQRRNLLTFNFYRIINVPVDTIRSYYGEEIAFYFAWVNHYTSWLTFMGFVGLITYAVRYYRNQSIDEDQYTPIYGLVCFSWSILMQKYWKRKEVTLAHRYGTLDTSGYSQADKLSNKRSEFDGVLRHSPITGKMERYYPSYLRRLQFVISGIVTLAMLSIAFTVMILSLNVQGYINPKHNPDRWPGPGNTHPFHWGNLSILAEEGRLFDMNHPWKSLIPVVIHAVSINILNTIYREVATKLTEWENHETHTNYNNSLILKRFLFEAFDCYIALFYLAFYEHDVVKLRNELVAVFNIDTIRRLGLECLLPMILQKFSKEKAVEVRRSVAVMEHKKTDNMVDGDQENEEYIRQLSIQANRDEYEQFDDYMEMVIELGYVTLFASAYPLASFIAIIANVIEMRSDMYKITYLCRRPRAIRTSGIGVWYKLINCIVWASALTNCFLFAFTSNQLASWCPGYFIIDEQTKYQTLAPGKGRLVVFVIFAIERVLMYGGLLIGAAIPDIPEDVTIELERRDYVRSQQEKLLTEQIIQERRTRSKEISDTIKEKSYDTVTSDEFYRNGSIEFSSLFS